MFDLVKVGDYARVAADPDDWQRKSALALRGPYSECSLGRAEAAKTLVLPGECGQARQPGRGSANPAFRGLLLVSGST